LARAFEYRHENSEAEYQLHKLLVLDSKDRDAALNLAGMLTQEKKYSEAVAVLERALETAPDSIPIQLQLGFADVRNGQSDKGLALLQKALMAESDETRSSSELNSVAYTLAELNAGMDVAQQYAEKSVKLLDAQSLTASGSEAFRNTATLGATWDTQGWIHFKQGQYEKALPYLKSAWLLSQRAEVGDHLGQLYAKLGRKQEAAETYRMAYAAVDPRTNLTPQSPIVKNIADHYQELLGKGANPGNISTTRKADGTYTVTPAEELSRMRMSKITTTPHPSASGSFDVVFTPGKVEDVSQVDGDRSLQSMVERIKAAKFNLEFPDSTPTKIVRRGILSCGSLGCELTLLPVEDRGLLAIQ
jgi:tetratricopeptide (TPR) repeat protein